MKSFQECLNALGDAWDLTIEGEGNDAALEIDNVEYGLRWIPDENSIFAYSTLVDTPFDEKFGDLAQNAREILYRRLLQAQFCGSETGHFTFGVDPNVKFVNLQAIWPANLMDASDFLAEFEKFYQMTNLWRKRFMDAMARAEAGKTVHVIGRGEVGQRLSQKNVQGTSDVEPVASPEEFKRPLDPWNFIIP